jgi:uncharacterized coiled-coil protein SlyX
MLALNPGMVLGAYVASHVDGRRVALLGDCRSGVAEQLAELAGRRIHAYDPEPERVATSVAQAARHAHSAPVSFNVIQDDLDAREGAFDVAIVPDLGMFDDIESIVALAESLVGQRGLAFFAIENTPAEDDAAMGYYELYDLIATRFEHVSMLGQAPFFGATVADFAAEADPAVTIDSSLATDTVEPSHFIAVASGAVIDVDPYTLVQLPGEGGLSGAAQADDEEALARAWQSKARLAVEVDKLKEQIDRLEQLARDRKNTATQLSTRVAEVEAEREQDAARLHAVSEQLAEARQELAEAQAATGPSDDEIKGDVARLEAALAERSEKIQNLEDALRESERVGRAMIAELKTASNGASAAPAATTPAAPTVASGERIARYEADLQAAHWKLETLASELEEQQHTAGDHVALEQALAAAQAKLAARGPE